MLSLAYSLTDTVEIDGKEYEIDLSFDNVLRLIDMLNDEELDDIVQIETGLYMLLGIDLDYDIEQKEKIFYEIFKSTIDSEEEKQKLDIEGNPMPNVENKEEKVFSLKQDADYIFASFYQDYGIDLIEMQGKMHWDKFKALLGGLKGDTKLKEVLEIRTMELPKGKGTSKERSRIKKLKEIYELKEE